MNDGRLIFAWTSAALVAGAKTVTRRDWGREFAMRWRTGDLFAAYDRRPEYRGVQIAACRLVSLAYDWDSHAPDGDYEAEGFAWMYDNPASLKQAWWRDRVSRAWFDEWRRTSPERNWVVRFEVVSLAERLPESLERWRPGGALVSPAGAEAQPGLFG